MSNEYLCWRRDCSSAINWGRYTEGTDYGFYSHNNSDCILCQQMCDLDPKCGAVNCAGKHEFGSKFDGKGCMWWRVGACVDDYETHVKPRDNANKGYLCYKGKWKTLTIVKNTFDGRM